MLTLKNVKKDYVLTSTEAVHALKGISLDFRQNEFVSVLGPSGCGKTTLMNIIGGLDKYTEGDLIIDGKSTKYFTDYDWDNYRNKKIGFVFQTYNLIQHLSVLQNVELSLTLSGCSKEERKKRATEALQKVGLYDQLNKKPNQLSGGQMQRVAIARAIVNSPDILLADEPTGALDTATSEQIMQIIQNIAKDKLVIMVTHNPSLAEKYSTRLIKMLDGVITSDTDPYDASRCDTVEGRILDNDIATNDSNDEENAEKEVLFIENPPKNSEKPAEKSEKKVRYKKDKTSMSFLTALSLSLRNLFTKKARTILTSIAGSIGIIGISLILALSNGMNGYIKKLTTDTLSSNPIQVTEIAIDLEQAMSSSISNDLDYTKYPAINKIFVEQVAKYQSFIKKNTITEEYIEYLQQNLDASWYNDIIFETGQELNVFTELNGKTTYLSDTSLFSMAVKNTFLKTQYDVLAGTLPEGQNDLILVVDEYNRLSDNALMQLGIIPADNTPEEIDFENVLGKKYYFLNNDGAYTFLSDRNKFDKNNAQTADFTKGIETKISCILRINQSTDMGILGTGIYYTGDLYNTILQQNMDSALIKWMTDNPDLNPINGNEYEASPFVTKAEQHNSDLRLYGGNPVPNSISIYPVDFNTKEQIKSVLQNYNVGKSENETINFTDMSEIMGNILKSMVDVISYILIAFTAISLVVSCVMIGIITYVSVIERTKEIGILRAIGARKKDITRVFNAETFIIGLIAGLIGEIVTYLLTVPINFIIYLLTNTYGIANLNPLHALIMIIVSIGLTLIAGLIPAFKASKKDPVLALRSE